MFLMMKEVETVYMETVLPLLIAENRDSFLIKKGNEEKTKMYFDHT